MLIQTSFQFFCSSILIVYDGDATDEAAAAASVTVKMIDLAHTLNVQGIRDDGYILGLTNLIRILEEILQIPSSTQLYDTCQELLNLPCFSGCHSKIHVS